MQNGQAITNALNQSIANEQATILALLKTCGITNPTFDKKRRYPMACAYRFAGVRRLTIKNK